MRKQRLGEEIPPSRPHRLLLIRKNFNSSPSVSSEKEAGRMVNVLGAINLPNSTNIIISQFYLNFRGTTLRGKITDV